MLNSKNYIFFIVPYVTVVCSLYHTVYYGLFNLNGLSLLSISDIIKSAAYPMLLTFLSSVIGVFFARKLFRAFKIKPTEEEKSSSASVWEKVLEIIFYIVFWTILVTAAYFIFGQLNYIFTGFAVGNILISLLDRDRFISDDLTVHFDKEFVLMMLVYFPCFSIATGVQEAEKILDNKSYKYTINTSTVPAKNVSMFDTLKFIGMNEEKYIFIDTKNERIFFIKTDSLTLKTK